MTEPDPSLAAALPASPAGSPRARAYDAVLFDFGGVFIDSPFGAAGRAAERLGIPFDILSDIVFGSYHDDTDHPWHRLERGEVSFDHARAEISSLAVERGLGELDPLAVLAELGGARSGARDFAVELVRELRAAGFKTSVVTNNIAEFADYWRGIIPLDDLFDDVVDSSAVAVRKPNPAIYALACERLGVEAERAIFVDDFDGNVVAARAAGLAAICCGYTVESTRDAFTELRGLAGLG